MRTYRFLDRVCITWSILFLFLMLQSLMPNSSAVIYISDIVDLQKIGNDPAYPLDGEYELTQDIDASDAINWNSGAGFDPIGSDTNPFTGRFDGKGYKISKLYINRPSRDFVGLFGYVGTGGEVMNARSVTTVWIWVR